MSKEEKEIKINDKRITPVYIEDELKKSYLTYSMSVIVSRALPDVRDGLKPVHRRILYSMSELGLESNKPYKKSARVVGDTMGRYHPHGDAAIYNTIVRMAQDFSMRYVLIDGQGNFGSIDGDEAAAMRYTEVRMKKITEEMLADIDKDTVDFVPNFDDSLKEPSVLPTRIPNLIINGVSGIAVGMATNIPPHNIKEIIDAIIFILDNPEEAEEKILHIVKGPDFPTGGTIVGKQGIINAYKNGKGSIIVRGNYKIEEGKGGKKSIIIYEIPYMVNKAELVEQIANLINNKIISGVSDLRDESDREGIRVVIELKKDENEQVIINQLFKHTNMQISYGINMLALKNKQPIVFNLYSLLNEFIQHRFEVVIRRTKFELKKAEEKAHILEGLRIALDNLDEVIKLIRSSVTTEEARTGLMTRFGLTEIQANAILDMRLQRLTGLEREKLENEYKEIIKLIERLKNILSSKDLQKHVIKEELLEIKQKYGDKRKSEILDQYEDINIEDLIKEEDMLVTISHAGYIKRTKLDIFRPQNRGGKGISAMETKENDFVERMFVTSTHDYLLFFTNKGRCFWQKVYSIPEGGRATKGKPIVNLLKISGEEKITAVLQVKEFSENEYLFMVTKKGYVKKTPMSEFRNAKNNGLIAIKLMPDDKMVGAIITDGHKHIILGTNNGMAIHFSENEVRPMGRNAIGVGGIKLKKSNDYVIDVAVIDEAELNTATILTVTEKGYGKRTKIDEYRLQSRAGYGIINMKITEKTGKVVALKNINDNDQLMIITNNGTAIRMSCSNINTIGRVTLGVKLIDLDEGAYVVDIAKIADDYDEEEEIKE